MLTSFFPKTLVFLIIYRSVQVSERDIATAYDPSLVYEDYVGDMDPKRIKKMQKKINRERRQRNKSTSPMIDKDRKQAEKDALEEKKREARQIRLKEKARERKRIERAKIRARRKKIKPKVFCECKAREFKIIEARRTTLDPWGSWCPPDPAPEQEIMYEQLVLSHDDMPPPPPPIPIETRDLMVQIDLPPIEPGTALSDEMYDEDELDKMGSIEFVDKNAAVRLSSVSRSIPGIFLASSQDKTSRSSIPRVPKTPRPQPRSQYDTKPKPKPRVREIVMQTDSDPGPLREQNVQYEKQCVCRPGPNSKCTCKVEGEGGPCSCKTVSPLDGGPPCICKPRFGPGYRTKRRKKCKSRKCKKCREKGLSGRDYMAKTRTKDERVKEEQEKIRIEKAKMKAMRQVQKFEGRRDRGDLIREKAEMKAATERIKEQLREKEEQIKEQKRREIAKEKRLKAQLKEQRRQAQRDEDFRRRLSEMRRPEAEFCGCKDWQKGVCRVKIPPDILEAREALLRATENPEGEASGKATKTPSMTVMLARSVDNSDSEFILPTHMQPRRRETLHKSQYETANSVTNATISRDLRDSIFEVTNHLSLSENDIQEYFSGHGGSELRSQYDDMRMACSSSFHRKYSPERLLIQNITKGSQENTIDITPKRSHENVIRKDFKPTCGVSDKKENWQQNTWTTKSAYPNRQSSSPPDAEDHDVVASTSTAVGNYVKSIKTQPTRRRRIPEHDVLPNALKIDNDIIAPQTSNKALRPRHRLVCTNVAETVFTRSDDETKSIVDMNQSILTQENNNSSTSKSGIHKFVEMVFNKRKDTSKERFRHETQHSSNQVKNIRGTVPKTKQDKSRGKPTDKFLQGGIKIKNSRFTKRKFGKNIVTSLISIFHNSSCHMPKGASSVIPAQLADSRIAEEPSDGQGCGRPLFAADSSATSVTERPGRHLLGSPTPARRHQPR